MTQEYVENEECESEGPKCPYCGRQYTADEGGYYSESYEEETCDECKKTFDVEVCHSVYWITTTRNQE